MKKKIVSFLLALVMTVSLLMPSAVLAEEIPDVTQYSYQVTPLLAPFTYFLYVKTDNPDPTSFRLVDPTSRFFGAEDKGRIMAELEYGTYYVETDPGCYYVSQRLYPDVAYENETTWRVAGGYIFLAKEAYSDGGELILMQKTKSGDSILSDKFEKTNVTVSCQPLSTRVDYLIQICTDSKQSLFENLDAVQNFLNEFSIYPRSVYDSSRPNEDRPYPFLATSPYWELTLNEHYEMFERITDGTLALQAYPFVLDSLGVPGTISSVARELEPNCEVDSGATHANVEVSFKGETRTYGGAGQGGNDPLYSNRIEKEFTFRGGDLGSGGTIEQYRQLLLSYRALAGEDAEKYRDLILGETYRNTIRGTGGTWIRVAVEGFGYGTSFVYVFPEGSNILTASDAWVDGRYVTNRETIQLHETFENHPTADIIVQDLQYIDCDGQTHTQNVRFTYNAQEDAWTAYDYYTNHSWYSGSLEYPQELILTHEEVAKLDPDRNTHHWPEEGLVYDGTEYPGTPFTVVLVTGIQVPETLELHLNEQTIITAQVLPADAGDPRVRWTCSDESVVQMINSDAGAVKGVGEGTAVLTCTSVDGNFTAVCTVTVVEEKDPCADGHSFTNYVSDGNAACGQDGTKTAKCDRCDAVDTVADTGSMLEHQLGAWSVFVEPTCTREGIERSICGLCGTYETRTLPMTAHTYEDGSCIYCGAEDESARQLPGDTDNDGVVTYLDAMMTLRYAVGLIELTTPEKRASDLDGSGVIDYLDAMMILRLAVGLPA